MRNLSFLIKPASSLCNLQCRYCFYFDISQHRKVASYGVMKKEIVEAFIDFAFSELDETGNVTFAFQGGEPTMATLSFYQQFTAYVEKKRRKQRVHYAMQTNGILLDKEWTAFFQRYDVLVGISLDGFQNNHDYFRRDSAGNTTFQQVIQAVSLLKEGNIRYNVLCVLTNHLAKHPQRLYQFFKDLGCNYIQLIPCLNAIDGNREEALTPEYFYSFYHTYFFLWYEDMGKGSEQHVNLFDNLMLMLEDQAPYQCGMLGYCSPQLVIEADGSLYPCDFYVDEEHCCGYVQKNTFNQVIHQQTMQTFLQQRSQKKPPCFSCPYENLCHGGCKRMNTAYLQDDICAYRRLLEEIIPYLLLLIQHRKSR